MERIDENEIVEVDIKKPYNPLEEFNRELSTATLESLKKKLDNPSDVQKEMAALMKLNIDNQMMNEMKENGRLSSSTLKWISVYNELLDKIHKNTIGTTNTSLHLHKITHSQITNEIRKVNKQEEE